MTRNLWIAIGVGVTCLVVTHIANTANGKISADAVTEFEVRIQILNSSYQDLVKEQGMKYPFRPGMTASVDIITDVRKDILTVPLSAVTTRAEEKETEEDDNASTEELLEEDVKEVVFVNVFGVATQQEVKTGISDFENIQIVSGIEEGAPVISGPFLAVSKRLKDGDAIEEEENDRGKNKESED